MHERFYHQQVQLQQHGQLYSSTIFSGGSYVSLHVRTCAPIVTYVICRFYCKFSMKLVIQTNLAN